jgi:hypothetical protein
LATKPGQDVNPNGFPSGEHHNLNIIGKKAEFNCPDQEYYLMVTVDNNGDGDSGDLVESCDETDVCVETETPIYRNVIFVPQDPIYEIKVFMESGKKGPKGAQQITELQVTDWCTGFSPNDSATLRLPKNDAGYDVYARALATPTDNPNMTISPSLVAAEDESGNDLIWLGLLTSNGFATSSDTFTRNKGKSTAVPITGLFEWTGNVCYIEQNDAEYCYDEYGNYVCTDESYCCADLDLTQPGYEHCDSLASIGVDDGTGNLLCPADYDSADALCRAYQDEWVFNISDFVTYLWDIDNNGLKLLQVRFYPR